MFHVPEASRNGALVNHGWAGSVRDGNNGAFVLPSPEPGWSLGCIASDQEGWEHVSAHAINGSRQRCPNWKEMCFLKATFWDADDLVVQYHPRESEYVNDHPFVLHLWRPTGQLFPEPPAWMVGNAPTIKVL